MLNRFKDKSLKLGTREGGELARLRTFLDALEDTETPDEALDAWLAWARVSRYHAAAIFSLAKTGRFRLEGATGRDRNGDWFEPQVSNSLTYAPGADFITQTIDFSAATGSTEIRQDLHAECFAADDQLRLSFGILSAGVAVGLVGSYRPFGVCVLFKRFGYGDIDDLDVEMSELAAGILSSTLALLAAKDDAERAAEVSARTAQELGNELCGTGFEGALQSLITPKSPYVAVVLRLKAVDSDVLRIVAKVADEPHVNWRQWRDHDMTEKSSSGIIHRVFQTRAPVVLDVREADPNAFLNPDWIKANRIQTVATFPLPSARGILGTLTVYTCYPYRFDARAIYVFGNIAESLVKCALRFEMQKRLNFTEQLFRARGPCDKSEHDMIHFLRNLVKLWGEMLHGMMDLDAKRRYDLLPERVADLMTKIRAASEILGTLLSSGKRETFDLLRFLADTLALYRRLLPNISFNLDCPAGLDFNANPSDLSAVLLNVIMNAERATRAKQEACQRIEIVAGRTFKEVSIAIRDNGIGLNPDEKHLFLAALNGSFDSLSPGWGLNRIRDILKEYNAKVDLDSPTSEGTHLTIRFPISQTEKRTL